MSMPSRGVLAAAGRLLLLAIVIGAYMSLARAQGDVTLAVFSVENGSVGLSATDPSSDLVTGMDALAQSDEALALFQISSARERMPEVAESLRRADLAMDAVFEIRRLNRMGVTDATLAEAPAVAEAMTVIPELQRMVAGSGQDARVDTGDEGILELLQMTAEQDFALVVQTIGTGD